MNRYIARFTFVAVLSVFLIACGAKVTDENFNKISDDMTYDEVVRILGEPQTSNGGTLMRKCVWKDDKHQIEILFRDQKVEQKSFTDNSAETVNSK